MMESQELLHPENSEIQNNEVNLEASNETQTVNETATPESAVEPETAEPVTEPVEETVAEPQPEASAEEPQEEPATEPVAEEPAAEPVAEEQPAEEAKAQEPEKPEETLEQVEAEYANFDLAMLVAELEKLVAEPNFNIIKQRVGVIRAKALEFLRERRRARQAEFEAAKTAAAEAAAAAAEKLGIRVYTIGVGTKSRRTPFKARDMFGRTSIQYANMSFDESQLKSIAEKTHARYFAVNDKDGLKSALEEIDTLEKTTLDRTVYQRWREFFAPFLLVGALLLVLAVSLQMSASRRLV